MKIDAPQPPKPIIISQIISMIGVVQYIGFKIEKDDGSYVYVKFGEMMCWMLWSPLQKYRFFCINAIAVFQFCPKPR